MESFESGFTDLGVTLLSSTIATDDVAIIRNAAEKVEFLGDGVGLSISQTLRFPLIEKVVFSLNVLEFAHSVLGEHLCLYPNITIRKNSQTPWHIDDAFRPPSDGDLYSYVTEFLQVSTYFQANGKSGGGLDVVPRSHRLHDIGRTTGSIRDALKAMKQSATSISSRAGDSVCWDGRLMHRSTPWKTKPVKGNFAVHWTFSSRNADCHRLFEHLRARGRNEKDFVGVDRRYGELDKFEFKRDASSDFCEIAKDKKIELFDITSAK